MPQQHEMFDPPKLSLTVPAGLKEPRLWVRRLAIWEAPGGQKIRDIELRPGLNIIWSPDGFDDDSGNGVRAIGHGSGKTLFCRLLRYCLGEQRFADETQRERISVAFPNGIVGAEVMLDGVCWAVVRPLGIRRRHVAIADGSLDEIAAGDGATTSIDPLIEAIEQSIVTRGVAGLARLQPGQKAWPIALAWLSRDQECRFDDVLDWRSPASGSDAPLPASGRETGPRREALRAFLTAITEEEQQARRNEEALRTDVANAEREISYLDWDRDRRHARLIDQLGLAEQTLPEMPLLLEVFQKAVDAQLAGAAQLPTGDMTELGKARKALLDAREELRRTDEERIRLDAQVPAERQVLTLLSSEIPSLSAAAENAASQVCPICEVPIDKALAEKCGLSHKLHDETECRARLAAKRQEVGDQKQKIDGLEARLKTLQPAAALGRQPLSRIQKISGGNLARNWLAIPHVTNFDKADVTGLEEFRKELNAASKEARVTMVAFLIKASALALRAYPRFNTSLDGDELVIKNYVHVGFAADTPKGLMVPVIRDCDRKGVLEIATEMRALADKARGGGLSAADMQGGCFSVSSLGGIGGAGFTPIINAPEVAILQAAGRRPSAGELQLAAAGVTIDARGFIEVDAQMRTRNQNVFAVGDVTGNPMLAHKAVHQGHVAAEAASGLKSFMDEKVVPSVAYTDPEIAWVGVTEDAARAAGRAVEIGKFPWAASGRAIANGADYGLTKLVFDKETHRIIGGAIVGPSAGDMVGEICLAIEMGADAVDIGKTIHPHPTLGETIGMAAEVAEDVCTDLPPTRRRP